MPKAKSPTDGQIHAVVGSDEAEVKRAAKELARQLGTGGEFGSDFIDGAADNADQAAARIHQVIDALLTFPFFGGEKLVWLKSATFLADSPTGRATPVLEALEKLTETLQQGLPPGTRFLLSAVDIDKRRSFYKSLQKLARVEVFDGVDTSKSGWEHDAGALAAGIAEARGLEFAPDALELFTLFTGGERRIVENELEKLDLYLGSARRRIEDADVRLLVPLSRAGVIFELGNAVCERDLRRALEILDHLLFQGESAIGVLFAVLIPTIRNLLLVRDLTIRHKLARPQQPFFFGKTLERLGAADTAHLPRKKDGGVNAYPLGVAACHGHRYSVSELRDGLEACLNANVQLVTTGVDPKVVLTQLVSRIVTSESRVAA